MRVMHIINAMNLGGAEMVVLEHIRQAGPDVESTVCAVNKGGWAMQEAERLGATHNEIIRCRSADLFHAAAAMQLGCEQFVTFDEKQRTIAMVAGLTLKP